jgi:4-hydroxymandelate oxidase
MTPDDVRATSRRRFLQYLSASPLFASTALPALAEEAGLKLPDPMIWAPQGLDPIKSPKDAINVFDFEPAAFAGDNRLGPVRRGPQERRVPPRSCSRAA